MSFQHQTPPPNFLYRFGYNVLFLLQQGSDDWLQQGSDELREAKEILAGIEKDMKRYRRMSQGQQVVDPSDLDQFEKLDLQHTNWTGHVERYTLRESKAQQLFNLAAEVVHFNVIFEQWKTNKLICSKIEINF